MWSDISNKVFGAVRKCIELNVPFALYMFPDEENVHFCAAEKTSYVSVRHFFEKSESESFSIAPFTPAETIEVISPELDIDHILSLEEPAELKQDVNLPSQTSYEEYSASGSKIIESLQNNGGKVVMSRVIVETGADPVTVAIEYFKTLPSTFRSLFYTPDKGLWLGATPEVLATYSLQDKSLTTMSLAGTRPLGCIQLWDSKNIEEHNFVTEFIKEILSHDCEKITVSDLFAVKFGSVEHLCEIIKAEGVKDISGIISGLSPTPAVCGTPRDYAFNVIGKAESHTRECYGGWLGVKSISFTKAFVNLRCAKIFFNSEKGEYIYKIYAGGGFTAKSSVHEEWEEAGQKASTLLNILKIS